MSQLHLIKLCVGINSIAELTHWVSQFKGYYAHITRMMPKRTAELLAGGSLYWVIKGQISCRQKLLDVTSMRDEDGISRCKLVLEDVVVPVMPRPFRAFQGWRYLTDKEAPQDLLQNNLSDNEIMPEEMQRSLAELGLL